MWNSKGWAKLVWKVNGGENECRMLKRDGQRKISGWVKIRGRARRMNVKNNRMGQIIWFFLLLSKFNFPPFEFYIHSVRLFYSPHLGFFFPSCWFPHLFWLYFINLHLSTIFHPTYKFTCALLRHTDSYIYKEHLLKYTKNLCRNSNRKFTDTNPGIKKDHIKSKQSLINK